MLKRNLNKFIILFIILISYIIPVNAQSTKQHSILLTWTASTTTNVNYNIYRSTTSGGTYSKLTPVPISSTTYTDLNGTGGTTYYYVVTAIDSAGYESVFSNQASATFLANPTAPSGLTATSQ